MKKYKDKQVFESSGQIITLAVLCISLFLGFVYSLFKADFSLVEPAILLAGAISTGGLIYWYKSLKMKVSINGSRIKYKMMSPIHQQSQRINWDDVEACDVVRSNPASRWHGSNIHFANEHWCSLNGRNGLSVKLKNGEKHFIGIRQIDQLKNILDRFDLDHR